MVIFSLIKSSKKSCLLWCYTCRCCSTPTIRVTTQHNIFRQLVGQWFPSLLTKVIFHIAKELSSLLMSSITSPRLLLSSPTSLTASTMDLASPSKWIFWHPISRHSWIASKTTCASAHICFNPRHHLLLPLSLSLSLSNQSNHFPYLLTYPSSPTPIISLSLSFPWNYLQKLYIWKMVDLGMNLR